MLIVAVFVTFYDRWYPIN